MAGCWPVETNHRVGEGRAPRCIGGRKRLEHGRSVGIVQFPVMSARDDHDPNQNFTKDNVDVVFPS